jgi:murein DD-endopeptidase MepM/ murein hydrolase activator NlpD
VPTWVELELPSPVRAPTSIGAQHDTAGLPAYPARDFFAPAGTPVLAPRAGIISGLSGHDPAHGPTEGPHGPFGWSIYLMGDDHHSYYLTHLGRRDVKIGQYVHDRQVLGAVGNYARYGTPSHIHLGIH